MIPQKVQIIPNGLISSEQYDIFSTLVSFVILIKSKKQTCAIYTKFNSSFTVSMMRR